MGSMAHHINSSTMDPMGYNDLMIFMYDVPLKTYQ